jgi:phage terminase large subunit
MIVNPPPNSYVKKVTYRDNPFFPEVLRQEMEYDRRVDPESAANVWDGELAVARPGAIFKGKWRIDTFVPQPDWDGPYQGADWGFSVDPTVLVRVWIHGHKLYIEYESWALHCELDDIPDLFDKVPMARNYKIMGDSARPDTISHICRKGFKVLGAEKYKGSVEEGVSFLKSFEEIVIHERNVHTIAEAKNYSYKLDRLTGEPTTDIEDKHNHCWDAVRYALHRLIALSRGKGRPSIRSLG